MLVNDSNQKRTTYKGKTIRVSMELYDRLTQLKSEGDHDNYSVVIQDLVDNGS